MDNKDQAEGNVGVLDKPVEPPKLSSSGNLKGPPGKPTAIGLSGDSDRPLTGYDRKRAVRATQEILGLSPQARKK